MKPLELDILWMDAGQVELKNLGVGYNEEIDNGERKKVTFYRIDAIFPTEKYGKDMTCVMLSGEEYIADILYKQLKNILDNN